MITCVASLIFLHVTLLNISNHGIMLRLLHSSLIVHYDQFIIDCECFQFSCLISGQQTL